MHCAGIRYVFAVVTKAICNNSYMAHMSAIPTHHKRLSVTSVTSILLVIHLTQTIKSQLNPSCANNVETYMYYSGTLDEHSLIKDHLSINPLRATVALWQPVIM